MPAMPLSGSKVPTMRDDRPRTMTAPALDRRLARRLTLVLAAALLGTVMVWGAGFAGADLLHDAAHDSRHALGFPCH
jgi:cobalt transporter subunit CbtB